MAAFQRDYGQDGDPVAALVPDSLIAYRHFYMSADELAPMTARPDTYAEIPADGVFHATCRKPAYARHGLSIDHEAPRMGCTCGFYAHYSPGTDFYRPSTWLEPPYGPRMVRAVVELSGTVIIGSRGVRAQKLRVRAISVDWEKYRPSRNTNEAHEVDVREEVELLCRKTAARYGAEHFESPSLMYEAYPEPDLSHLDIPKVLPGAEPLAYLRLDFQAFKRAIWR